MDGSSHRCRYHSFYGAAVFLYPDIERNSTTNFRENKIFVLLFQCFGKWSVLIILYIIQHFVLVLFSLMFYGINFFVAGFRKFFVFGIKKKSCRAYQEWWFGIILSCHIHPSVPEPRKVRYQFFKVILKNKREYLYSLLLGL